MTRTVYLVFAVSSLAVIGQAYPTSPDRRVKTHLDTVQFLRDVMFEDRLWRPIIGEKIRMKAQPREHLDHFNETAVAAAEETTETVTVDTFKEIVSLMMTKTLIGTEVAFVMAAVRRSLACSVLKHVSLQGFLLHHLIAKNKSAGAIPFIIRWLEHMLRVSLDKLAAVDHPLPLVARMHSHVKGLLAPYPAADDGTTVIDLSTNDLNDISENMFVELGDVCAVPAENAGRYSTLIAEFKRSMTLDQLRHLDTLLIKERMKGVSELNDIKDILTYHGSLNVAEDVEPAGLESLTEDELKKISTINRIKMNYVFLNLPVKSLSDTQWRNLLNLQKLDEDQP